jgi:RNA-directed DNA polymerase
MGRIIFAEKYEELISLENLLAAWREFEIGKRGKSDVQEFKRHLMSNLLALHRSLVDMSYRHQPYTAFVINDPKRRQIHKASIRDRVLHRALYRKLYPFFDRTFFADSFSCRVSKGTHKANERFTEMARMVSLNHRKTIWVLKCDVKKFFASIDQRTLLIMLDQRISDWRILWLIQQIIESFSAHAPRVGLPLGNLTSQIFANVYMNELDQYLKHKLHIKHYIRYADDFVLLSRDRGYLESVLPLVHDFLFRELQLVLHPDKIELKTVASGVDFLGWVHFPDHRVLRGTTRRRMMRALSFDATDEATASYLGLLQHGNAFGLMEKIRHL